MEADRPRPLPRLAMVGFVLAGATLRLWNLRNQVMGDDELRAAAALTLSEFEARLPALICGLLALVVFPRMFSGRVERFPVELMGWLVALSPALVLHSRMALPYMPLALVAFAVLMALERRAFTVVGALAVLAVAAAPFVARVDIPLETVGDVLRLQAGTRSWPLTVLFWILALVGLVLLARRNLRLGLYTLAAAAGYVAGVLLLSPAGLDDPIVLNRWLLPVLPFVFLWVAMAIGRPWIPRSGLLGQGLQRSAARFFILFLFWTGPFLTKGFRESPVMHHDETLVKAWDLDRVRSAP
ncbi:MAG TPA: hypothetical protein VNW71_25975 [Thermoanaerobaculia bacterium]|nr:hypothetical protein [Thermoanaerobaculia bacterium]